MNSKIPFVRPRLSSKEFKYVTEALQSSHWSGDGAFTKRCHQWMEQRFSIQKTLLTHSCTAALEMACLLFDLKPGDEVILPSFTFVSTANAVVLRGAVPVFVDIRPDTLNIDENLIEAAITPKTKAIIVVHYAGVSCEMNRILEIARIHKLHVLEDAAQGVGATYYGKNLGTLGDLGAVSFHETKNIVSGEGGALYINAVKWRDRAEHIREKGTNRSQFFQGLVDRYTWVDVGSSYLPSDLLAAILWAQFEDFETIQRDRMQIWNAYHHEFAGLEKKEMLRRPFIPEGCVHNAHLYYLILPTPEDRRKMIGLMREDGIAAPFHYIPLHSSPAGKKWGRASGELQLTEDLSQRMIRLPLFVGMEKQGFIVDRFLHHFNKLISGN